MEWTGERWIGKLRALAVKDGMGWTNWLCEWTGRKGGEWTTAIHRPATRIHSMPAASRLTGRRAGGCLFPPNVIFGGNLHSILFTFLFPFPPLPFPSRSLHLPFCAHPFSLIQFIFPIFFLLEFLTSTKQLVNSCPDQTFIAYPISTHQKK